jgi:lysophospholipase L1-like esterase
MNLKAGTTPSTEQKGKYKLLTYAYVAALHGLLLFILMHSNFIAKVLSHNPFKNPDITSHYRTMLSYQKLIDSAVLPGSNLFFGDSLTQGLAVSVLNGRNVNFGIGQDTTVGLLKRLPDYSSLRHARAVVIAIGVNDLWIRDVKKTVENYAKILNEIPDAMPIIVNSVFPVDPSSLKSSLNHHLVHELNQKLIILSRSRENTTFIDMTSDFSDKNGALKPQFHVGDGLHINTAGYQVWIEKLEKALSQVAVHPASP